MSNFIEFTYQHTCKIGQEAYILQSSPFKSSKKKKQNGGFKIPFLGEGYYLWEENLSAAVRWGKKHYRNKYSIVEYSDVKMESGDVLDFLNRRNVQYFNELKEIYTKKRPQSKNWPLGNWIEFFKSVNKKDGNSFPFNYIRAEENLPSTTENDRIKEKILFTEDVSHYTYLSPLLILCVIDKTKLSFKGKSLIK